MYDISKFIAGIKNSSGYWEETAMLEFATMLNEEMKNNNMSKSQLAKKVGVSKSYISKILGGENTNFTLKSMVRLMFAVGKRLHLSCTPLSQEFDVNSGEINDWLFLSEKSPKLPLLSLETEKFLIQDAESNMTFQHTSTDKFSFDGSKIAA